MTAPASNSVLLISLQPGLGGVTAMVRLTATLLREQGYDVTTAWRAFYAQAPELSVRIWRSAGLRPGIVDHSDDSGKRLAVGTYLPEFEWAHHQPWAAWRRVIDAHARIVIASGSNLAGWAPVALGRTSLQWVASPFDPDRAERTSKWPWWRRFYDGALNAWVCRRQERHILETADTIAISGYTERGLAAVSPSGRLRGVVPIPVDAERFAPGDRTPPVGRPLRVGFNGRVSDPRKNMTLLVDAFALAARENRAIELHVRGDLDRATFIEWFDAGAIADRLHVGPPVPHEELPAWYRFLDVFVIASHQEGLSIVGTEAMASGAVVVSLLCGRPEDFVIDGVTGLLCGFAATDMAGRFLELADDEPLRARLGAAGVELIRQRYAQRSFEHLYMRAFERAFA